MIETNGLQGSKPFYTSKTFWGGFFTTLIGILSAIGLMPDGITADELAAAATAVGTAILGVWTIYGRWVADKKLSA